MNSYVVAIDCGYTDIRVCIYSKKGSTYELIQVEQIETSAFEHGMIRSKTSLRNTIEELKAIISKLVPKKYSGDIFYCIGMGGLSFCTEEVTFEKNLNGQTFTIFEHKNFTEEIKNTHRNNNTNYTLIRATPITYNIVCDNNNEGHFDGVYTKPPYDYKLKKITIKYTLTYVNNQYKQSFATLLNVSDDKLYFYPIASAKGAYLLNDFPMSTPNDTILIDLGADTIGAVVYHNGVIINEISYPFGTKLITSDLTKLVNLTYPQAESIKLELEDIVKNTKESEQKNITFTFSEGDSADNINIDIDKLKDIVYLRTEELIAQPVAYCTKFLEKQATQAVYQLTGGGSYSPYLTDITKKLTGATVLIKNHCSTDKTYSTETQFIFCGGFGMINLFKAEYVEEPIPQMADLFEPKEDIEEKKEVKNDSKNIITNIINRTWQKIDKHLSLDENDSEKF